MGAGVLAAYLCIVLYVRLALRQGQDLLIWVLCSTTIL